jgi:hypothetical protein
MKTLAASHRGQKVVVQRIEVVDVGMKHYYLFMSVHSSKPNFCILFLGPLISPEVYYPSVPKTSWVKLHVTKDDIFSLQICPSNLYVT